MSSFCCVTCESSITVQRDGEALRGSSGWIPSPSEWLVDVGRWGQWEEEVRGGATNRLAVAPVVTGCWNQRSGWVLPHLPLCSCFDSLSLIQSVRFSLSFLARCHRSRRRSTKRRGWTVEKKAGGELDAWELGWFSVLHKEPPGSSVVLNLRKQKCPRRLHQTVNRFGSV